MAGTGTADRIGAIRIAQCATPAAIVQVIGGMLAGLMAVITAMAARAITVMAADSLAQDLALARASSEPACLDGDRLSSPRAA